MQIDDILPESTIKKWRNEPSLRDWAREELPNLEYPPFHSLTRKTLSELMEEDAKEIEELESKFRNELLEFLSARQNLEHAITRRRATLSPIRALPEDVLSAILCLHFNSTPATFSGDSMQLHFYSRMGPLFVCRRWKNVALSSSSCWRRVRIDFDIEYSDHESGAIWDEYVFSRIKSLLENQINSAGGFPIDVEVATTNDDTDLNEVLRDAVKIRDTFAKYWDFMRSYTEVEFNLPIKDKSRTFGCDSLSLSHLTLFERIPDVCLPHLQSLCIGSYKMLSIDLEQLRLNCPALQSLHITYCAGPWSNIIRELQNLSSLQTLQILYVLREDELNDNDGFQLGIKNVILPVVIRRNIWGSDSPIAEFLDSLPNLANLGLFIESGNADLGLGLQQFKSNTTRVTNQIQTLCLHGSSLKNWKQASELAHFSSVTRLEFYPIIGIYRYESYHPDVPWNIILEILWGATQRPTGQPYLPRLKELYFRDMYMDPKVTKDFLDSILSRDTELLSNGEDSPPSGLRLTFSLCKLCWSCRNSTVLPDADRLSLRQAKEFFNSIINEHTG